MEDTTPPEISDAEKIVKDCIFELSSMTGDMAHGVANNLTQLKTLDMQLHSNYRDIEELKHTLDASTSPTSQDKCFDMLRQKLSECEEVGRRRAILAGKMSADIASSMKSVEKIVSDIEQQNSDANTNNGHSVENNDKSTYLSTSAASLEFKNTSSDKETGRSRKRRSGRKRGSASGRGRKARRKANDVQSDASMQFIDVDSEEKPYCLCQQVSYGEMILCENKDCPFLWFHFPCVNLVNKPRGKWYCPNCRGGSSKVLKKELRKDK